MLGDHVIHALAPTYPVALPTRLTDQGATRIAELDAQVSAAYANSLRRACEASVASLAFCPISAGACKGCRGLYGVLSLGLEAIKAAVYPGLHVHVIARERKEAQALTQLADDLMPQTLQDAAVSQ